METLFEIVKVILPFCATGIITFLITRYTYLKNIPNDKLEITYNRVYYPVYRMIRNNEDILKIIEKSKAYFDKYNKYIDRSTEMVFKNLKDNPHDKGAYSNFKDNIYSISRGLRRRLGYLEPSQISMYTYLEPYEKCILRLSVELPSIYLLFLSLSFIKNELVLKTISILFLGGLCWIIIEIGKIIYYFIKKRWKKIWGNRMK